MPGLGAIGTDPIGTVYEYEATVLLKIADLRSEHRLESVTLTQVHNLTIEDLRHDHRLESVNLTQVHDLNIEDLRHEQTLESTFLIIPIDTVQNPPSEDKITKSSFGTNSVVGVSESPFTLREKQFEYHGERWEGEFELMPLEPDEVAEWKGWLAVLEGRGRRFYMKPPYQSPRGTVSQNGTVGSITRPREITINGLTANETGIFKEGDYIQLKDTDQLLMVLKDADSDGSGTVTVTVGPKIRKAPSNGTTVETQDPQGLFQLDTNEPGWQEQGYWTDISFPFVEVVSA